MIVPTKVSTMVPAGNAIGYFGCCIPKFMSIFAVDMKKGTRANALVPFLFTFVPSS